MKKRILVTGGLGYIGSHTTVELINNGFEVVIIDDLSNSEAFILDRIEEITGVRPLFEKIDLKNKQSLENFLKNQKIDGVIHFAAYKAVGESVNQPLKYYKNNVSGLINLLEVLEQENINNFIFSSSCTVYGQADKLPIDETAPLKQPESPYGTTKAMCERILKDYSAIANQKTICLRYFNPIGAHESAKIGELPIGVPNNLVPYITQTAMGIRSHLNIFGDDYPTRDGTAIRDYIYIGDLADAHVRAIKRVLENKNKALFEAFNLGTGLGTTVLETVKAFEKASNLKLNYEFAPRREGDVVAAYANNQRAKEELDWNAGTSLEIALGTAWKWQKSLKE